MEFEARDEVFVDEYIEMITGKTAVLLSLCAVLGSLVAGQNEETLAHYAKFGLNLGLAFQVIDDILGIWGDESKTGKSAATDIATKKKTLPVLYGLERSAILRELYKHAEIDERFVREVVSQLDKLDAKEYASEQAATYSQEARRHLRDARPEGDAGKALLELADMLLLRDY
jgi:geranylgeranyl diphosphate synthase type I